MVPLGEKGGAAAEKYIGTMAGAEIMATIGKGKTLENQR